MVIEYKNGNWSIIGNKATSPDSSKYVTLAISPIGVLYYVTVLYIIAPNKVIVMGYL